MTNLNERRMKHFWRHAIIGYPIGRELMDMQYPALLPLLIVIFLFFFIIFFTFILFVWFIFFQSVHQFLIGSFYLLPLSK